MKEDTRAGGPWAKDMEKLKIKMAAAKRKAENVYTGQDLPKHENFLDWQKEMDKYLRGPIDDRTIDWVRTWWLVCVRTLNTSYDRCMTRTGERASPSSSSSGPTTKELWRCPTVGPETS